MFKIGVGALSFLCTCRFAVLAAVSCSSGRGCHLSSLLSISEKKEQSSLNLPAWCANRCARVELIRPCCYITCAHDVGVDAGLILFGGTEATFELNSCASAIQECSRGMSSRLGFSPRIQTFGCGPWDPVQKTPLYIGRRHTKLPPRPLQQGLQAKGHQVVADQKTQH